MPQLISWTKILWLLLAAHAVSDVFLQDPKISSMGEFKKRTVSSHWPYWLWAHGCLNGLAVFWVTGFWILGLLESVLHAAIDMGKTEGLYNVHVDQALHLCCKLTWATYAVYYS